MLTDEAALGVNLRIAWRALVMGGVAEERLLPALEKILLSERAQEEMYATLCQVSIDRGTEEARIRLFGHPPPLVLSPDLRVTEVNAEPRPPLGMFPDAEAEVERFPFPQGSTLMLYTDGLVDAYAGNGSDRLGVTGLARIVEAALAAQTPAVRGELAPPDSPGPAPLVRFEKVSFGYPASGRTVLRDLDLEIRPGELLAIVGLNGAGKSTLIKLLAGLYRPDSGRITVDGVDLADIDPALWRQKLSIVFQDFVRYQLTARDNVALGQASLPADQDLIDAAAASAGLEEVLGRLPDGWDTPLSRSRSGGVDLSGGQWQQVVLARALYAVRRGARLLVLDEPTAHLDVRTEFEVFDRLAANRGETSVVLISHRLSTVRQADRIVLLDGGRIVESGTHEELMALGGVYAEMFAIQAERFRRGHDDRIEEIAEGVRL